MVGTPKGKKADSDAGSKESCVKGYNPGRIKGSQGRGKGAGLTRR